jgi:hypothetical protein
MELIPSTYYDKTKFSNTFYLAQIALEGYFARNVLRANYDRVIYASEGYAFRQRLNLLSKSSNQSIQELQLPFMCYYRRGNWEIDDRPAIQNSTAALYGFADDNMGGQRIRWLNTKTTFDCVIFYSNDADAQLGYESLLWVKHPTKQQFNFSGLEYLSTFIDIPIIMEVESMDFAPAYTEKEWLTKNRIFPIKFSVSVRSVALSQQPQSPESDIFWNDPAPVLTKKVQLDFLAYKYVNSFYDASHIDLEVEGTLNPELALNPSALVTNTTNTTLTITWAYDVLEEPHFHPLMEIVVNGFKSIEVAMTARTYTFTDLEPQSLLNITLWFYALNGKIAKTTTSGSTSSDQPVAIKGIKGYTL